MERDPTAIAQSTSRDRVVVHQRKAWSTDPGFRVRGPVEEEWGRSESLDPDNVGDIADEGAGHRG